jgi:hypothetical protein
MLLMPTMRRSLGLEVAGVGFGDYSKPSTKQTKFLSGLD